MSFKLTISSIEFEGRKVCDQIIAADDSDIDIELVRKELIAEQSTELKKSRIKKLKPEEVLFEYLYRPEIRNEKKEARHRQSSPLVDRYGREVSVEYAVERLEFTDSFDMNHRSHDTDRLIENFEGMEEISEEVIKYTTEYMREVLISKAVKNISTGQLAKDMGKDPDAITHQMKRATNNLKRSAYLKSVWIRLTGRTNEEDK